MKDSQRSAVYRWENRIRKMWPDCDKSLTLQECEKLVCKVWADYRPGDEPPRIADGRGRRRPGGGRWYITLPRSSRTTIIVLHEIGHSLQRSQPWHGREFARLALELFNHYADIPLGEAKQLGIYQKPRRVRFATAASIPQQPTRKWRQWKKQKDELHAALNLLCKSEPKK